MSACRRVKLYKRRVVHLGVLVCNQCLYIFAELLGIKFDCKLCTGAVMCTNTVLVYRQPVPARTHGGPRMH